MSLIRRWCHHDGSARFVSAAHPALGEMVSVRLWVEPGVPVEKVWVRAVHDGEPRHFAAKVVRADEFEVWWEAQLPIRNPRQNYRWFIQCGSQQFYLNAAGLFERDVPDGSDFVLAAENENPEWIRRSVVYQIFPDRFANSGKITKGPTWSVPRDWNSLPEGRSKNTGREWFGGDLWGIAERLDYLQELGVEVVYLTPFFPANSTHRYDAITFDQVDPWLGGDEALIHLTEEASKRSMKVIGDLTLNHCGVNHAWFIRAQQGDSETRDFFYFDDTLPHGYECWFGLASLPKFNFASERLRTELISGENSIVRQWLRAPFNLSGWRIDVANMAGRNASDAYTEEISQLVRKAVEAEGSDKILVAEHFHDSGADLSGAGWQGAMAYSTTLRPIWSWLASDEFCEQERESPTALLRVGGVGMVEAIEDFASRMPWSSRLNSWNLLDSHDTARIRTVVGSDARVEAAVGLLIGLPGVPMVFQGDELASVGRWGEESRTPMPWQQIETTPNAMLSRYRELLKLRRSSEALAVGGLRWLAVDSEVVCFVRESASETLLFVVARSATEMNLNLSAVSRASFCRIFGEGVWENGAVSISQPGTTIWRVS